MKLYYAPGACSLASHIALREAGLDFEAVKVEGRARKTAGGEDYLKVTPKGYVPALRLDDGSVLTEGTAILPFIADQNPAARLAPAAAMAGDAATWGAAGAMAKRKRLQPQKLGRS